MTKGNLFLRNDTIFGVCEGLGQDLGINPNFLRVPLATGIMFAPVWVVGIYLALGLVVMGTRYLVPDPVEKVAVEAPAPVVVAAPANATVVQDNRELAEAA